MEVIAVGICINHGSGFVVCCGCVLLKVFICQHQAVFKIETFITSLLCKWICQPSFARSHTQITAVTYIRPMHCRISQNRPIGLAICFLDVIK